MNPKTKALQERTHRFFIRVLSLCERLPNTDAAKSIGPQLIDSAGSTDSNYRAACRGRSKREFIAKLGLATEEADEAKGWLNALVARGLGDVAEARVLLKEADELISIFVKSQITAKRSPERNGRLRR
jgi:four helix bundle protein